MKISIYISAILSTIVLFTLAIKYLIANNFGLAVIVLTVILFNLGILVFLKYQEEKE